MWVVGVQFVKVKSDQSLWPLTKAGWAEINTAQAEMCALSLACLLASSNPTEVNGISSLLLSGAFLPVFLLETSRSEPGGIPIRH